MDKSNRSILKQKTHFYQQKIKIYQTFSTPTSENLICYIMFLEDINSCLYALRWYEYKWNNLLEYFDLKMLYTETELILAIILYSTTSQQEHLT